MRKLLQFDRILVTLKFVFRLLFIQVQALRDIGELLRFSGAAQDDHGLLATKMRHLAHMLEKSLENPEKSEEFCMHDEHRYQTLGRLIKRWESLREDMPGDIRWVKKIYHEFSMHRESGWYCVLLKMAETKLRGVKEIYEANDTNSQAAEIDLLQFIKGRRSIRDWLDEPVPEDQIELLVEAANWAPSSCNRQTSRFIVIRDKSAIREVASAGKGARSFFHKAPVLIVVVNDIRPYQMPDEKFVCYQDAAAAIQNMLLMAHRMGLAACWGTLTSDSGQIIKERGLRRILGIQQYFKVTGMVALGKPNARVCVIPRT
ncbi:nitroreductase family protein, partial [bacterium]|nr:nitroreductase family protein [bacterium]